MSEESSNPPATASFRPSASERAPWLPVLITALQWLLFLIAAWYYVWPCYRAFLNIDIATNEGWNAFYAEAAFGRMPLYPSAEKLITNNYPPVSYYIVGGVGHLMGDPILAGRLLSLAAVLVLGVAVAAAIRALGGDRTGAAVGGAIFVATISRFCPKYVGMNEPQLMSHAIMAIGFVGFLRASKRERSCLWPILLMAFAGFSKHNIIAMPVAALLWLAFHRPREAAKCAIVSGAAIAAGFGLCFALYGHDFFLNMLSARQYSWASSLKDAGDLKAVNVALAATILLAVFRWQDARVRLTLLLAVIALAAFFLQRTGAGVDINAAFDLIIASSIGAGLAFSHAGRNSEAPQPVPTGGPSRTSTPFPVSFAIQAAFLLILVLRFGPPPRPREDHTYRLFFDPSLKTEIAIRETAVADSVAKVRATPGAVMTSNFVCYRSGKPFTVDKFNAEQRVLTGALPPDAITSLIESRRISVIHPDRRGDWYNPLFKNAPAGP